MMSIDNTYSLEELNKYGERIAGLLPDEAVEWVVELKIDGVAVSLTYENGQLVRGATRGDGRRATTSRTMCGPCWACPCGWLATTSRPVEVRGEIYMTNSDLGAAQRASVPRGDWSRTPTPAM